MGTSYIWYERMTDKFPKSWPDIFVWLTQVCVSICSRGWAMRSQPTFRRCFAIKCLWGWIIFGQPVSSFFRNSDCWLEKSRKPESGELRDSCSWVSLCPCCHGFPHKMGATVVAQDSSQSCLKHDFVVFCFIFVLLYVVCSTPSSVFELCTSFFY